MLPLPEVIVCVVSPLAESAMAVRLFPEVEAFTTLVQVTFTVEPVWVKTGAGSIFKMKRSYLSELPQLEVKAMNLPSFELSVRVRRAPSRLSAQAGECLTSADHSEDGARVSELLNDVDPASATCAISLVMKPYSESIGHATV